MKISAIICTYKRYDLAQNCLRYLAAQHPTRAKLEIVIVDNTPAPQRENIDWLALGATRHCVEDLVGLSRARNRGIKESTGDIIAFVDDDAEVFEHWADTLHDAFKKHPKALVVGGNVIAKYVETRESWVTDSLEGYLSCVNWGEGVFPLKKGQWVVGANMAFRRKVFDEYGVFDVALGRAGAQTLLSNEETALMQRLPEGTVFYCHDAKVNHLIPPERVKQAWFRKRVAWQAISDLIAGEVPQNSSRYFFEQFAQKLPLVPAEYRSFRSLSYPCQTGEQFERQLRMIYEITVASGGGLEDF